MKAPITAIGAPTSNAQTVFEARYLLKDDSGLTRETVPELYSRVAESVAMAEKKGRKKWAAQFERLMVEGRFLPNSPTLMNAGKKGGQLSACYVLPIEDDLGRIFDSLKEAALIHQSGGGTGFSFSRLRPSGDRVQSSSGVASGPLSFLKIFDAMTDEVKQGGARRGANMGILRVDHPNIEEFIRVKNDGTTLTNFNLSVGVTDEFVSAVTKGSDAKIRDPRTGVVVRKQPARELFRLMAQNAWSKGDPGVVFLDRINRFNPTPAVGEMESTNPCGEQPLLPHESCNLGSLNLSRYSNGESVDWNRFREDIHVAVRFLDDVIDVNHYPVEACKKITRSNRKIGLGVMGWADLLLVLGISYDSPRARELGEKLMSFLDREAKSASALLAREKGAFPNFKKSMWARLGYPAMRNATVSTVAPTGTISILAGCSSGIEPIFAGVFYRNVLSGQRLKEVHPAVERALRKEGRSVETVQEGDLAELLGEAWAPAHAVSIRGHIEMQAAFQRHSDSAVSKTINLPESATVEEIENAYLSAYLAGCKGITVFRDRSRGSQVLETERACERCERP